MPAHWRWLLARTLALLVLGGTAGTLFGSVLAGLLLTALAVLAWHLYHLYLLERWLSNGGNRKLPEGEGIWPRVFSRAWFFRRRAKSRSKRFRRLIREVRASTEALPDGGVVLNDKHEILNYNETACRLLGLRRRRDRGQRIESLIRDPDFAGYLQDPAGRPALELPAPGQADTWMSCRLIPYGPGQSLLVLRDVTQAVRIERMRRNFVANASHELRSPLTVIAGYLDAMAEDPSLDSQWREPVAVMNDQALLMRRLVEDLLRLSKLESSSRAPVEEFVDIGRLAGIVARDLESTMATDVLAIELAIETSSGLLGDESELRSIISNLVSNAVRYTPAGGKVTIRWSVDDTGGSLVVTDTGIGIAPEDIPRLTERFYRTDAGRARQKGGTGLGLAIVKHALRRHDGELSISSRLGEGSTFSCRFPPERVAQAAS
ncbi:MAG: phosphate regulon sensor histidine kinase PhoR [Chromatiales bacterium]|nr:phosphate regulon sensor histidine kinase PhoR [Chromatiales bacterium]